MDKATRVIGYIGLIPLLIGSLFKIQHWPGAGILLILSTSLLAIGFMPMYATHRIMKRSSMLDAIEGAMMGFTGMILIIGMLFKIQHWPGSGPIMIVGSMLLWTTLLLMAIHAIMRKEHKEGWNRLGIMFVVAFVFFGWALNWSKNYLEMIQMNEELIQDSDRAIGLTNQELFLLYNKTEVLGERIQKIVERTDQAHASIDAVRNYVINGVMGEMGSTEPLYEPEIVRAIDNYDIPTNLLLGNDPAVPSEEQYSGHWLRGELESFAEDMKTFSTDEESKAVIDSLFLFPTQHSYGRAYPWEVHAFYHTPFVSVMQTLSTLELSVTAVENRMLQEATWNHFNGKLD